MGGSARSTLSSLVSRSPGIRSFWNHRFSSVHGCMLLTQLLLTSKKFRLQREGRQSPRHGVEMKSDWLFDKPRSNYWLRVPSSNLASQSPCLAGVTQSHCNPQSNFLRFLGRLLGPEEGMERVLGQT